MATDTQTSIPTLGDVMNMMAPFAGGSVPDETDTEYGDWLRWIQQKQEEYARRAFWRRCLTRAEIEINGETTLLPVKFNKPNGIYMLVVDEVDWMEENNEADQYVFVEMDNNLLEDDGVTTNTDFGRWRMRFKTELTTATDAVLWYFANPPKPVSSTDKLLLPGDMIGYAALAEYYRTSGAEGSQDKAEADAENRFQEYLALETIPAKNELLKFNHDAQKIDYLVRAKGYYETRNRRYRR